MPLRALDRLSLGPGGAPEPPLPALLDAVAAGAPALRHLALPHRHHDAASLEVLARHPLLARLEVLDLFTIHHRLDLDALWARRGAFGHLTALLVGSHLAPPEPRFAAWPAVQPAAFDRRELRVYDRAWAESVALPAPPRAG